MQTDDSYQAVFRRLGRDEYGLTDLAKSLGDFDQVDLTCNFVESSDSLDSCFIARADYIRTKRLLLKLKAILSLM